MESFMQRSVFCSQFIFRLVLGTLGWDGGYRLEWSCRYKRAGARKLAMWDDGKERREDGNGLRSRFARG